MLRDGKTFLTVEGVFLNLKSNYGVTLAKPFWHSGKTFLNLKSTDYESKVHNLKSILLQSKVQIKKGR